MKINLVKGLHIPLELLPRFKFSWLLHFLYQFGAVISWVVITALFVQEFGLENLLYLFAIEAGLLIAGSLLTHQLSRHVSAKKIVNVSAFGIIALLLSTFWADQTHHVHILFGLALIAKDVFYPRLRMGLLRTTEELFTPSQAERAIPFTESALTIGALAGAAFLFSMIKLSPEISTQTMLSWWIFPIVFIIAMLAFEPQILHEVPELSNEKKLYESKESTFKNLFRTFKKVPFLRTIAVMIFLQGSIFAIIEYNTVSKLEHELDHTFTATEISISPENLKSSLFENAKEGSQKFITITNKEIKVFSSKLIAHNTLLHDLSALHLMVGLLAVIVNFWITPFFLRKKGIIRPMFYYFIGFIFVLPVMLLGGAWPIVALRSYQHGFHSMFNAGYHITFYSAFEEQREFIRHVLEGIVAPAGILLGIGTMLLLQNFSIAKLFPWALALILLGLAYLSYKMIPRYTHLAIKNLKAANNIREKLHAIEVLGQTGHCPKLSSKTLCKLLEQTDTHTALREKIIRTLQHIKATDTIHEFSKILQKENEPLELKIKILESMLKFDSLREFANSKMFAQHKLLNILKELFESSTHQHMKKLIVMNIFSHLPADQVVPFFLKTMDSNDEIIQSVCLRSCQMFNDPDIASYIEPYLKHNSPRVRSHALIALWKFLDKEELTPHLHSFLNKENQEQAIAGLYAIGEIQDTNNHHLLSDFITHENQELKLHALIAQAKLGNKTCIPDLINILFGEDEALANKVFEMLKRRVPKEIYNEVIHQIKRRVAKQVWQIIGHHPKPETLRTLPSDRITYLKRLYKFAGQHDDILILEQAL